MKRFFILLILFLFLIPVFTAHADELDDLTRQLSSLKADLASKEGNYAQLSKDLDNIKNRVIIVENEIVKKEKEVRDGERVLEYQKSLLNERAKSYYINANKSAVSLVDFLIAENLSVSLNNFFYQKSLADEDKNAIIKIVIYIKDLEEKKSSLQGEKTRLAALKTQVDEQSQVLGVEISKTKQEIAALSARQQQLIAQKQASLNLPQSAYTSLKGCSDDRGVDPGFSPRLAFFTYGAPHRNGLNQYGAKGRADAGKKYDEILNFYYSNFQLSDVSTDTNIIVSGTNEYGQTFDNESMNIEDYVKHIYEMPTDWPIEALKAQAVAARTYGWKIMKANGSVKPSQANQVVKKEINSQSWIDAVDQTKGKVMTSGGEPILAEYASTHGGYVLNLGKFDGDGGNPSNFGDLNSRAFDKSSPWFYCDWGARSQYKNTAWLQSQEVADIVNVILLVKQDSSAGDHMYQTDKPHPYGGEVWNEERVRNELKKYRTPFTSISSVDISADFNSGKTTNISFNGDAGNASFSGDEFKNWFNLRAPANVQIVGPLFNVEKQ